MRYIQLISGTLILFFSQIVFSQTEVIVRDFETWSSVGASVKLDENSTLSLEQGLRLYNNSGEVDQILTNLQLKVKLGDLFSIAGGIRYIRDKDRGNGSFENQLRFNGDLGFKHKWDRFTFDYRLRLQTKNELGYSKDEGDYLRNATRLKAGIHYNIKNWKLDPEFSGEIFRESGKYMISSFNKFRLTVGTKYKINKFMDIKAYYRFEREMGVSYPQSTNIVGFKLMFNLSKLGHE